MKLFKPSDSSFWHIGIVTEDGSQRTIKTFCSTREEAEAVVQQAKVRELEAASLAPNRRLTSGRTKRFTGERWQLPDVRA